jgi:hypothetical protein
MKAGTQAFLSVTASETEWMGSAVFEVGFASPAKSLIAD